MHIFRHLASKFFDIRQYACEISRQSDEKSDCAICTRPDTKQALKSLVDQYSGETVRDLGITSITGKMRIVKSVQIWFRQGCQNPEESVYLDELAACIDVYGDSQEMLDTLDKLRDWCNYRNEIIHALLNKNLDSLYQELPQRAEEGMVLARTIDKHVRRLKSKNSLRKFLKLKEN